MANEIQIQASLIVSKNGTTIRGEGSTLSITMSGSAKHANEQPIGTSTEQLTLGDISDIGYLWVKNNDATNFVEVGIATPVSAANASVTLKAGEFALIPTRLETWYAKADTATVNLEVVAVSL